MAVPWATAPSETLFVLHGVNSTAAVTTMAWSDGLDFDGRRPFYPTLAVGREYIFLGAPSSLGCWRPPCARLPPVPTLASGAHAEAPKLTLPRARGDVAAGALTVSSTNLSDTSSGLFVRSLRELPEASLTSSELTSSFDLAEPSLLVVDAPRSNASRSYATMRQAGGWRTVANTPRLDFDAMPKDRMALLVHPHHDEMLFVAGNADARTWRVEWRTGLWSATAGHVDTADGSAPHPDCRNYYWEPTSDSLILLTDGGAHLRTQPTQRGGKWLSLSGDIGAMEMVSAHYEARTRSWVGGAQDNAVQFAYNASSATRARGFIFGDGTVTAVDGTVTPPRFYGASQLLGAYDDNDAPHSRRRQGPRRPCRHSRCGLHSRVTEGDDDPPNPNPGFGYATYEPTADALVVTSIHSRLGLV